jgi:hydrogenase nickel incorporation protein HypA/HybF
MHELAITQEIVDAVSTRCPGVKIARVVLEIGQLSQVMPDAVRFCFDLCCSDTDLEGAELEIIRTPGLARCTECQALVTLERPFGRCDCGSTMLDWIQGEELAIREVEVRRDV